MSQRPRRRSSRTILGWLFHFKAVRRFLLFIAGFAILVVVGATAINMLADRGQGVLAVSVFVSLYLIVLIAVLIWRHRRHRKTALRRQTPR